MAGPSINTKVKLDGEKEYKAALAEINSGLKVLKSELNLASAQFQDNAGSVEALTKKNDILERSILTQQEKIEKLKETLQYAGKEYGESSEKTNGWKVALNNAEAELAKMQGELDASTDALKKMTSPLDKVKNAFAATKEEGGGVQSTLANLKEEFTLSTDSAKGLGTALTDVAGQFGIQLPDGAAKAAEALNGINAGAALAVTGVGLLAAAVVKAEKALISATKETAEYAKEIKRLASITGQSTDSLQEFDYAAEMIGVSADRIRDSLKETTNKMQEARDGNEATALAYQKLGVSIKDNVTGELRSAQDVFYDTIDALGKVQNQTERDALAMDLMSESAQELNPLIDIGSEGLKKYAQEAHDMGYVLDSSALIALNHVDDAYIRLQKSQESVKNQLAAEFAPYLTEFYEKITKLIQDGGKALKDSGLVDAFGMLLETAGDIIAPTNELSEDTVPKLTKALRPLSEVIALIADTLDVIVGLGKVVFSNFWDESWSEGWKQMGTGLGLNKNQKSNQQRLWAQWEGADTNAATNAAGYGAYYANGKYYGNKDAYLMEQYEAALANGEAVGSFEYWKLSHNASGTDYFYGGRTLVGENGPEEVVLPRGSRITSASETRYSGAPVVHVGQIVIDAKNVREFNDVVRIMMNERISTRMEAK